MNRFDWGSDRIRLRFGYEEDGPVRLLSVEDATASIAPATDSPVPEQPLVEVLAPAYGRQDNSPRYVGTVLGAELRHLRHTSWAEGGTDRLRIEQAHAGSGLRTTTEFELHAGVAAVCTHTTVAVEGGSVPLLVWAVTTFATGAVTSDAPNDIDVWHAASSWSQENRWASTSLRSPGLIKIAPRAWGETSRSRHAYTGLSTWSSGLYNPVGAVRNRASGATLAWQIEHNGAWHWETGENPAWDHGGSLPQEHAPSSEPDGPPRGDRPRDGAYVAVLGPTDALHQWSVVLDGERSFTTVPATFTVARSLEDAFGNLAQHRRATRRQHPQDAALPVVYNDYMNTLEGDPTEDKLLPLIDAAAEVGCEYFCIDAGWYDDSAGWWASVGDWQPSTERFPSGLRFVMDRIRERGMVPGLWLEPEVVGTTSRAAASLPPEAFLQRGGVRVREHSRYLLDLRSVAARAHLDEALDRLVSELGVGYFKLDYNVTPGPGTDWDAESVGSGLLEHNRALLEWLDSVLDRHPDLVLENCASGAMRSDFAMMSRLQLQSTSDQQDPLLYPLIAVGALAHVLPEQAANWAYPQPGMNDEEIAFTMCTGLAGRLYLAGVLSGMDAHQSELVAAGVAAHKATRHVVARSTPRFPTGLPTREDAWTTVAFDAGDETLVIAWRQSHAGRSVTLALPHLRHRATTVEQVYPPEGSSLNWRVEAVSSGLRITTPNPVASARMYRLTPSG